MAARCSTCAPTTTSGLADHPAVIEAAHRALDTYGYGMASVRFICGTQTVHKELESELSRFLGTDDTILYSSCFDANGGLFETILDEQDCVISDALNHASIIDGIRLSKARRLRYDNNDMTQLEQRLQEASDARYRLIATDGVFSMDGVIADLAAICDLADRYDAMVMVDDSHAVGCPRPGRPRHARALRRDGSGRHRHRHARQGDGRRVRRVHQRPARDRRLVASALAALPVQQLVGAGHRRHHVAGPRAPPIGRRAATPTRTELAAVPGRAWSRPGSRSPVPAIRSSP